MGRLLDEDDVVDWLLKKTEMYDETGYFVDKNVVKKNIESQIANIPSAQPETHDKRTETHACDCISKSMVCEIMADIYPTDGEKVVAVKEVDKAYEAIQRLPSAQSEPKRGKWHRRFYPQIEMMVCSECQEEFSYDAETGIRDYNYCPNCGSDMRGKKE